MTVIERRPHERKGGAAMSHPATLATWIRRAGSRVTLALLGIFAVLAAAAPLTRAQDDNASAAQATPPSLDAQNDGEPVRAVRLSYVDGKVQLSENGQVTADPAVVNTPLVQGMTVTTSDDGRAEIQFEDGSIARVAPNSALTLRVLSGSGPSGDAEMDLKHGLAYFELQGTSQVGSMRVHFADATVTASGFTVLRVTDDTPPGELAVFSGNTHIDRTSGSSIDLSGGQSVSFSDSDPSGYRLADSIQSSSWDSWNSDRDQALAAEASTQTNVAGDLAPDDSSNPAWNDLNANGTWYNVPAQGYVWSPYEAANAGFDPYGNGNWVFTPGFGYTFASGYSWGYMPYSCGAWNFYGGFGWGWAPGFGGCTPWWGTGFYGGPAIGFAPSWYRPIHRPTLPGGPIGGPGRGPGNGPVRGRPIPVISVHRQAPVLTAGLPPRDHNVPVSIGGQTIMGIRPVISRPVYSNGIFANRPTPGIATARTGRTGYTPMRPIYTPHPQSLGGGVGQPDRSSSLRSNRGWSAPSSHSDGMRTYSSSSGHGSAGARGNTGSGGFHGAGDGGFHGGSGVGGGGGGFHGGGAGGGSHGGGGGGGHGGGGGGK